MSFTIRIFRLLKHEWWRIIGRLIPHLPTPVLRRVAMWMPSIRPIGWFPGWQFAIEEQHPTPALKARLALWNHFRARRIDKPVRIHWVEGLQLDLVLGNDLSRCLYVCGSFEPNEFAYLQQTLTPGAVFIDVGANEGLYTIFAARRVGPSGTVVAVEPSPREMSRLANNVSINHLRNVRIMNTALGSRKGTAVLHVAEAEHSGQNTLGEFAYPGITAVDSLEIEVLDLDSLVLDLQLERVDVVKMDVEGSELALLEGGRSTLRRFKPILLIELFDTALQKQGASVNAVLSTLKELGYSFFVFSELTGLPQAADKLDSTSQNVLALHRDRVTK